MRNQNYAIRTVYLTIAILALFATASVTAASVAFAQSGATVYLQPVESAEGTLTVDVMADNVTDLYGAEFQLKYDPAALTVQDAKPDQEGIQIEGGTLLPAGKGFVVANKVNEAEGTVTFAMTLLNPAPSVNGSGPLARVTFNLLTASPSTIDITKAKLVALDLQTIPSTTAPLAVAGQGETAAQPQQGQAPAQADAQAQPADQTTDAANTVPAPAAEEAATGASNSEFPWWIVAAGVLILGVVGLAAFILITGLASPKKNNEPQQRNKAQHTQPQQQQRAAQVPQQPNQTTRTRPSAFK